MKLSSIQAPSFYTPRAAQVVKKFKQPIRLLGWCDWESGAVNQKQTSNQNREKKQTSNQNREKLLIDTSDIELSIKRRSQI